MRKTNAALGMHQTRLATGKRINSAEDDPAGLSIATKMNARSEGLKVALDNIGDAKNMLAVGESGLNKVNDILVQMRTKAEAAATDTLGDSERTAILSQLTSWASEVDAIVDTTKWNGKKLLDGLSGFSGSVVTFQVGADTDSSNRVTLNGSTFLGVGTTTLGIGAAARTATRAATLTDVAGHTVDTTTDVELTVTAAAPTIHTELATGNYTLRVNSTASNAVTVQLLDAAGDVVKIDNGAGVLVDSRTLDVDTADVAFSTGRGLDFNLEGPYVDGLYFDGVTSYSRSGTYNGQVDTASSARAAMDALDSAIDSVSTRLGTLGALGGRLSFREEALSVAQVNTEAAWNRIMNADFAFEQVQATKLSILSQTSMAMLGQANQAPAGILALFR